ncbi:hypothetical protein [Microcoleus sp.]|uniref:hypothetical protein n=1 Tax=Microcoleus sp. TaxID=44472 RepID=UPI003592FA12
MKEFILVPAPAEIALGIINSLLCAPSQNLNFLTKISINLSRPKQFRSPELSVRNENLITQAIARYQALPGNADPEALPPYISTPPNPPLLRGGVKLSVVA